MNQCIVTATLTNFKLSPLNKQLSKDFTTKVYHEVIYLEYNTGYVFIFSYGTVVSWLLSDHENKEVLEILQKYNKQEPGEVYRETYQVKDSEEIKIFDNTIYLNQQSKMTMLAISHGLAQSEKLGVFEYKIDDLIQEIQPLYQYLGKFGKISLSRNKISQKIGQLFSVRSFINLHMSILDTPDFFWEHEELEPAYQKAAKYLDLSPRMHALNSRMAIIQELYDVLHNELQTRHSHRLEWIIIILIFIEIVLSLIHL